MHGGTRGARQNGASRGYNAWRAIKKRCYLNNDPHYPNYGARGIKMCERWRQSYAEFLADMGEAPLGMSIERIDNDGDYAPENCRWATAKEQARNRRNTPYVTVCGERLPLIDACEKYNVPYQSVLDRRRRGGNKTRTQRAPRPVIEAFLDVMERTMLEKGDVSFPEL